MNQGWIVEISMMMVGMIEGSASMPSNQVGAREG